MKKSYEMFMKEINDSALYKGLLQYGFFSEKLPPIFTSESFYQYCQRTNIQLQRNSYDYIHFESMRNTNAPRLLGIPHPFAYENLCRVIKNNWYEIREKLCENTRGDSYRISRLHIQKYAAGKVLFKMNYENWRVDESPEADIRIGKRYVVNADISTCFPSIYTHSLPWALVGKDVAKNNRKKEEWYNQVDAACQKLRNGETHGLMIGPHTSNLLSEIILTGVDNKLKKRYDYIRKIDDYICYVSSMEEAQRFLTDLSECLQEYDLSVNHKKTHIIQLPTPTKEKWVREIGELAYRISDKGVNYTQVSKYLDSLVELMYRHDNNLAVFKYGIKVLAKYKLTDNARRYYIKTILHFANIYPYIVPLLEQYVFVSHHTNLAEIKSFSEKLFESAYNTKNYEALSYVLYFAIRYDFRIVFVDELLKTDYENNNSCLYKLFGWLYYKKHGMDDKVKMMKSVARDMKTDDNVFDRNWIFIYEILSMGLLKEAWKKMKMAGVSFLRDGILV